MKITITKNINPQSKVTEIEFTFTKPADQPDLQLHHISRNLTGTTSETAEGVFVLHGRCISFYYGNFSETFTFQPIDPSMTIAEITKHLKSRILEVKTWVESINIEEEAKVASLEIEL